MINSYFFDYFSIGFNSINLIRLILSDMFFIIPMAMASDRHVN